MGERSDLRFANRFLQFGDSSSLVADNGKNQNAQLLLQLLCGNDQPATLGHISHIERDNQRPPKLQKQ